MNFKATFSDNTIKLYNNTSYNNAFRLSCEWADNNNINLVTLEQV